MSETFDVVIAGGAVMGSSLAFHLAADPDFSGRILVVEQDMTYQRAASALSVGSIRQQFSTRANILVSLYGIRFLRAAREILEVEGEQPDIHVEEGGCLYLASAAEAERLRSHHALQSATGADIALMSGDEAGQLFPFLNTSDIALGAWGRSGEGWFDGYMLMQAFRRKARHLGVEYRQARVLAFGKSAHRVEKVMLDTGEVIDCGWFVNMAGASGARAIAGKLGFDLPVEARKRNVFTFEAREHYDLMPMMVDASGVYIRPEGKGYICGCTPPGDTGDRPDDFEVDHAQFEEIVWPALAHRVPAFEELRPGRAWAGHYDLNVFDQNAIVGQLPGHDNALIAAGFSGHGMQQSPAVGLGLAELITHGRYRTLDLSEFSPARIAENRPIVERCVI